MSANEVLGIRRSWSSQETNSSGSSPFLEETDCEGTQGTEQSSPAARGPRGSAWPR
jgi:hypothetical protein